jgi:membrane protein YqaA with SNARE-associated domain
MHADHDPPVLGGDWPDDTRTAVVTLIVGSIIGSLTGYYFGSMTGKPGPR